MSDVIDVIVSSDMRAIKVKKGDDVTELLQAVNCVMRATRDMDASFGDISGARLVILPATEEGPLFELSKTGGRPAVINAKIIATVTCPGVSVSVDVVAANEGSAAI